MVYGIFHRNNALQALGMGVKVSLRESAPFWSRHEEVVATLASGTESKGGLPSFHPWLGLSEIGRFEVPQPIPRCCFSPIKVSIALGARWLR